MKDDCNFVVMLDGHTVKNLFSCLTYKGYVETGGAYSREALNRGEERALIYFFPKSWSEIIGRVLSLFEN